MAFDVSEQLVEDCRAGLTDSLLVQAPLRRGYESTRAVPEHLAGREPARMVDSGARLVKREKPGAPNGKAFLFLDISKWLEAR